MGDSVKKWHEMQEDAKGIEVIDPETVKSVGSFKRILKYPMTIPFTHFKFPSGANPLKVGVQRNQPFIWFEVPNDGLSEEIFSYELVNTGEELNPNTLREYVDTLFLNETSYVLHVYRKYP